MAVHIEPLAAFRSPARFWSRSEVLKRPSPVPRSSGVYAWYLRDLPLGVPNADCVQCNGLSLLYIGIAPRPPAKNGKVSKRTLRTRLRQHYALNAAGSTLRLTLGCLLAQELGIELRRVGSGERMTFGAGERVLSAWMEQNAFVAWIEHSAPWEVEAALIRELRPPLNLADNSGHPFCDQLSRVRREAKALARASDVLPNGSAAQKYSAGETPRTD